MHRYILLCVLIISGCSLSKAPNAVQHSQSTSPTTTEQALNFSPPYPFTEQDMLRRFLMLTDSSDGLVTRAQIEKAFDIKVPKKHDFHLIAGKDWYFDIVIYDRLDGENYGKIIFAWAYNGEGRFIKNPDTLCISFDDFRTGFEKNGWIDPGGFHIRGGGFPYPDTMETMITKKDKGFMMIFYNANGRKCIATIDAHLSSRAEDGEMQ